MSETKEQATKLFRDAINFGMRARRNGWNEDVIISKGPNVLVEGDFEKCRDWMDGYMEAQK